MSRADMRKDIRYWGGGDGPPVHMVASPNTDDKDELRRDMRERIARYPDGRILTLPAGMLRELL